MPDDSPYRQPNLLLGLLIDLRAESWLGFVRSLLVVVGSILMGAATVQGNYSQWWLVLLVPLGLFNLVEVAGFLLCLGLPPEARRRGGR